MTSSRLLAASAVSRCALSLAKLGGAIWRVWRTVLAQIALARATKSCFV